LASHIATCKSNQTNVVNPDGIVRIIEGAAREVEAADKGPQSDPYGVKNSRLSLAILGDDYSQVGMKIDFQMLKAAKIF